MLQKVDNGFNGFQVPFIPRAARSSRRRSLDQKNTEDDKLCAFDLLATVAGKILLEGENPPSIVPITDANSVQDVVMEENEAGKQSLTVEHRDQGNVEPSSLSLTLELGIPGLDQDHSLCDASLEKSDTLTKIDLNGLPSVVEDVHCADHREEMLFGNGSDLHSIDGPEILDAKPPPVVNSDSSVKSTLDSDQYPYSSLSPCRGNNVNLVSRDDDENSSECIQPSIMKTNRLPSRRGERKMRKVLASKYWRMASRARIGDLSDAEVRCLYRSRKTSLKRLGSQRIYPFKRNRLYHCSSLPSSHADVGYKGVYNYREKAIGTTASAVDGSSACGAGQNKAFSARESHVKLRIKSFRVPELFIEMPETATIGSLKRTVMQAVSALLGSGLRVGVHRQGKKIRDDNRTLLQSGICNGNNEESLGFTLEPTPSHSQVILPVCSEENSLETTSTDLPHHVSRHPIATAIHQGTPNLSANQLATNLSNFVESDHDSTPSPADILTQKGTVDPCAIVALPEGTPRPLAVVHSHQKSNRSDLSQRRIRRPFSVSEVEALVQAVEKLGTGRWRDVKIQAFDNAKHRTYVDLKDKWKTLVHTARIAPQQRRGEPVPQELLDRVLAAHSYWTQHQGKQSPSATCLLL